MILPSASTHLNPALFPLLHFPPLLFCLYRIFHSRIFSRPEIIWSGAATIVVNWLCLYNIAQERQENVWGLRTRSGCTDDAVSSGICFVNRNVECVRCVNSQTSDSYRCLIGSSCWTTVVAVGIEGSSSRRLPWHRHWRCIWFYVVAIIQRKSRYNQ